ncbi:MAG: hypothetical protein ACRD8O_14000, partial [Bryobacteraceae bacterium]
SGLPDAADVEPDGTFRLENVAPGQYVSTLHMDSETHYVKSARMGSQNLLESDLNLTPGADVRPIEIVVSPAGATVAGTVLNANNQPVTGALVAIMRTSPPGFQWGSDCNHTGERGSFKFGRLAPGEYRVVAVERASELYCNDDDLLDKIRDAGERITLRENERLTRELKISRVRN